MDVHLAKGGTNDVVGGRYAVASELKEKGQTKYAHFGIVAMQLMPDWFVLVCSISGWALDPTVASAHNGNHQQLQRHQHRIISRIRTFNLEIRQFSQTQKMVNQLYLSPETLLKIFGFWSFSFVFLLTVIYSHGLISWLQTFYRIYSLISFYVSYWPCRDGRLSWPDWLTHSKQLTRELVTCQPQRSLL